MAKVIKAFSIDIETARILENYCKATDNWKTNMSRSKVVNDAIVWFLSGDVAELVHSNEQLVKKFGDAMRKQHEQNPKARKRWWKDLFLGLR